VVLLLGSSNELVKLTQSLFTGKHIKNVELDVLDTVGGEQRRVDEYDFTNVILSGLDSPAANVNELSFNFSKFTHRHTVYDEGGKEDGQIVVGWDLGADKMV
jgi:type VI protein secretion system component Hcp